MDHLRRLQDGELSTWSAVRVHEVPMLYMYVGQSRQSPALCKEPRQTHQQHDRGLPKTRVFDEYKDALPVLTHGEVS